MTTAAKESRQPFPTTAEFGGTAQTEWGASSLSLFTAPPSHWILFDKQRVAFCPGGGGLNPARAGEELASAHR